jgi:hypothetical protein
VRTGMSVVQLFELKYSLAIICFCCLFLQADEALIIL